MQRNTQNPFDAAVEEEEERYIVQPVIKAMQVLQLVCEAPKPVGLNDLVRAADMPKTTVYRYLKSLATKRLIEHDEKTDRYRPGIGLWWLSHASNPYEMLRQTCRPFLQELRDHFNETVNLGVLAGSEVFYLDMVESSRSLRMQAKIGSVDHLHSTALGKALLAFRPAQQTERILPKVLPKVTPHTITEREIFLEQLNIIRETGYALDEGEDEDGAYCVSAPICDDRGIAIAAISLSAPAGRMTGSTRQAVSAHLIRACSEISRLLRSN